MVNSFRQLGGIKLALYKYSAKSKNGEVISGTFDADSEDKLAHILHNKGFLMMDVKEIKLRNSFPLPFRKKVSIKDISLFCRQFHTMLNSGINLLDCLYILRSQVGDQNLADAIYKMYDSVQKGSSLTEAMEAHKNIFPNLLISMIEVGEVSGNLSSSLERMALYFEKENKISQKIKSAMAYPLAIAGITVLVIIFLMIFVVPQFTKMFSSFGTELPLPTRILIALSGGSIDIMLIVIISILLIIFIIRKIASANKVKLYIDRLVLQLPLIGFYVRKVLAYRLTITLSELLRAGFPLISSLEMCAKVLDNQVFRKKIGEVIESVSMGSALAGPLENMQIFPLMVIRMIKVGEESGTIDTMMSKVAEYYDDELDASISKFVSIIEPLMILGIAIIVGLIVVAMILPIFSSYQYMG